MEIFDKPAPGDDAYRISNNGLWRGASDTVDLREVLAKFWARKRFILASTLICGGLAFAIARLITPTYIGQAFVMIRPLPLPATDAIVRSAILGGPEAVPTEVFVLQSHSLASQTVERLHLDRDPEFDPSLRKPNPFLALFNPAMALFDQILQPITEFLSSAAEKSASDEVSEAAEADKSSAAGTPSTAVMNTFMKRLHVVAQERSNVIQVSFSSSRPTTAALVPNTLIQLYLEQGISEKEKGRAQEIELLDQLILPKLREKMRTSELALADYRQRSGLVGDQNQIVLERELAATKAQLAIARAHTAEATARLIQFQSTSTAGTPVPAESPTLQRLREQQVDLEGQLAALKGPHGPNYPKTLELEAQLKDIKSGIKREGAGFVDRLKAELAAAQAMEAALTKREKEFTHEFARLNGGDTQLQRLIGEADADRKTYEQYFARSNELHSNLRPVQPDASLVSRANVPLKPSFPDTKMLVIIGIALGAGGGMVLAAMIDVLLRGLRQKEQVEQALGLKCLGSVPMLKRSSLTRRRNPLLQPQNTAFGQAIRSVQLKMLTFDCRHDSQVVLVTAALPGEGKTWVAASLGACLAADGFSVALVDCDLHRPTVHRIFDDTRGPGLTDYFAGGVALDAIVRYHAGSGVSYLPSGTALSKEARRITPDHMRLLIGRLREKYAFIILDSAPILAVSETIALSQIANKAILVVKWGSTSVAIARHAAMQLLEAGGAETAVLLSMVDARRAAKHGDELAGAYKRLVTYYDH